MRCVYCCVASEEGEEGAEPLIIMHGVPGVKEIYLSLRGQSNRIDILAVKDEKVLQIVCCELLLPC